MRMVTNRHLFLMVLLLAGITYFSGDLWDLQRNMNSGKRRRVVKIFRVSLKALGFMKMSSFGMSNFYGMKSITVEDEEGQRYAEMILQTLSENGRIGDCLRHRYFAKNRLT